MKLGLISDIHGNLPALEEALELGARLGVEEWVCLGDIVDGGDFDNECARLIRDRAIPTVRGNHDKPRLRGIDRDVAEYLDSLPLTLAAHGIFFIHISPRAKQNAISNKHTAWSVFDETTHPILMVGHSHVTGIWSFEGCSAGESIEWPIRMGGEYALPEGDRYIVSVGPLGYSRDGFAQLRFCVWDTERRVLTVHPVTAGPIPRMDILSFLMR